MGNGSKGGFSEAGTPAAARSGGAAGGDRAEGEAGPDAAAEKIARLRALRLAKERSDAIAAEVRRERRLMKRP